MRVAIILVLCFAAVHTETFFLDFQAVQHHYGNPTAGCLSDEMSGAIQGASGYDVCLPRASNGQCSMDLPANTTAKPYAAVSDQSGNKYCILICSGLATGTCPASGKCVHPSTAAKGLNLQASVGICMYAAPSASARLLADN